MFHDKKYIFVNINCAKIFLCIKTQSIQFNVLAKNTIINLISTYQCKSRMIKISLDSF